MTVSLTGPAASLVDPDHRGALIVIDVQRSFADPHYLHAMGVGDSAKAAVASAVETTAALVREARALQVPVMWVRLESSPTVPWRASNWLAGAEPDAAPGPDYPCVEGTAGAQWYGVEPGRDERVIAKARYSGFYGTALESVLRHEGITWVTLAGLTTECCVASTAFDAVQRDIPTVVVSDATAAYDSLTHTAALDQLAANAAAVLTSAHTIELWRSRPTERQIAS